MTSSEQYFMSLQPKVRFQPTDYELITHFLKRKLSGDPLPMNIVIDESPFDNYSPAQLSQMYGFPNQNELYFFAQILRQYSGSASAQRKAGDGYWKSISTHKPIKEGNEIIGTKKSLRFYAGRSRRESTKTNWTMLEYRTGGPTPCGNDVLYNWVLCKVYENKPNATIMQDLNNQGKVAADVIADQEPFDSCMSCSSQEMYKRRKRRRLSKNLGQLPSAMRCTSTCVKPVLSELPIEIIADILSRLPVDSVVRFKCVCRQWCLLIEDYKFSAQHMNRASHMRLPCLYKSENNRIAALYEENFKLISCFSGLFLEKSFASPVFRIRNFATQQVLYLPYAHDGTGTMDFAFNSSNGECKVACLYVGSKRFGEFEVGFKVLTIGKDNHWKPLKLPNQNDKSALQVRGKYVMKRHSLGPDKVKGVAHLVEFIRDGRDLYLEVQSFDVWSECFTTNTLPQGAFSDLKKVHVFHWNCCLAVADTTDRTLDVWVLEDFKEHKWSQTKIIFPFEVSMHDPYIQIIPIRAGIDEFKLHDGAPNILLYEYHYHDLKCLVSYNMTTGRAKMVSRANSMTKYHALHKPSLMTLKGMRSKHIMGQSARMGFTAQQSEGASQNPPCKLLAWTGEVVAEGTIVSTDRFAIVHGFLPVGLDDWTVSVTKVFKNAPLNRLAGKFLENAIGSEIAWPIKCIVK